AEDGIRDFHVTGVQTCALPISTRAAKHPQEFLSGFAGFLHVDGYAAYESLEGVTLVGCWAHARRGFDEALKALPPSAKTGRSLRSEERRVGEESRARWAPCE